MGFEDDLRVKSLVEAKVDLHQKYLAEACMANQMKVVQVVVINEEMATILVSRVKSAESC